MNMRMIKDAGDIAQSKEASLGVTGLGLEADTRGSVPAGKDEVLDNIVRFESETLPVNKRKTFLYYFMNKMGYH